MARVNILRHMFVNIINTKIRQGKKVRSNFKGGY